MASIASELSDKVVLTLITQDPDIIIKEMEEGVAAENYKKVLAITDKTSY
jgi:UDP-N-acetylmuramoyl-L-alanyl-D-glutamate--2,6-diaminopimelate ligase